MGGEFTYPPKWYHWLEPWPCVLRASSIARLDARLLGHASSCLPGWFGHRKLPLQWQEMSSGGCLRRYVTKECQSIRAPPDSDLDSQQVSWELLKTRFGPKSFWLELERPGESICRLPFLGPPSLTGRRPTLWLVFAKGPTGNRKLLPLFGNGPIPILRNI